ncbi:YqjD family protein [Donghicola sp. XS_ASV15]|uniref:DUF883 family protein n=1 Tax=Donghicola sp. XS_ASV15 TaxID=3241295 RepID=UPI003515B59F
MATPKTAPDMQDLSAQIEALKADISAITSTLTEMGTARKDAAVSSARQQAEDLKAEGSRQLEMAQLTAEDYGAQAADAIRRQPATAVGIAVAAGFLAGLMTGRK